MIPSLPAGLQSVAYSFSNLLIQTSINGFGTTAIAAWSAIGKIDGVEAVSVNFLTQRLTLEAPEERMEEILQKADKAIRKFEPDCRILR